MSDVFEMPNNAESYYRKAQNLIEQKEYLQAADLLEKSYQLQPNFIVFNELVKLYLSFKIKDKLQTLWESYYPNQEDIYVDEELSFLYGLSLPVIYESQTASQKALWTFPRPFGGRNGTAAPSDASDGLKAAAFTV